METNFDWTPYAGGDHDAFSMDSCMDPAELIDCGLNNWNHMSTGGFSQIMGQPQDSLLQGVGGWSTNQPEAYTSHQIGEPKAEDPLFPLRPSPAIQSIPSESSQFIVPEDQPGRSEQYGSPVPALMVNDRPVNGESRFRLLTPMIMTPPQLGSDSISAWNTASVSTNIN